jgi:hypothetical protein
MMRCKKIIHSRDGFCGGGGAPKVETLEEKMVKLRIQGRDMYYE